MNNTTNDTILSCYLSRFFASPLGFPADTEHMTLREVWHEYLTGGHITVNDALNLLADLPRSVWAEEANAMQTLAACMEQNAEDRWSVEYDERTASYFYAIDLGGRHLTVDDDNGPTWRDADNGTYWVEHPRTKSRRLW